MRYILLIAIFGCCASSSYAQPKGASGKVKVLKIGIFTEELGLTEAEASKFWPLYNSYEDKIHSINKKMYTKGRIDWESKTDKEIEVLMERRFKLQEDKLKIEREYYEKFKAVLPIKKVAKIPVAQRKFKMTVFRKSKEGRRKRRGQ
ncbi:MAG: hypothetical protein ACPG19_05945 [Saprospiraceae bacterium]